jgi:hypothetical protein
MADSAVCTAVCTAKVNKFVNSEVSIKSGFHIIEWSEVRTSEKVLSTALRDTWF